MQTLETSAEYLEALNEWKTAKEQEKLHNARRLSAEEKVLSIVRDGLKNSGTHHFPGDLKIVTGVDSKWDDEALNVAHGEFIAKGKEFPFKISWKPDNKLIEIVKYAEPDLYQNFLLPALTIKPKKPSFSLKD